MSKVDCSPKAVAAVVDVLRDDVAVVATPQIADEAADILEALASALTQAEKERGEERISFVKVCDVLGIEATPASHIDANAIIQEIHQRRVSAEAQRDSALSQLAEARKENALLCENMPRCGCEGGVCEQSPESELVYYGRLCQRARAALDEIKAVLHG